jgi:hypothetical protein
MPLALSNPAEVSYVISEESDDSSVMTKSWSGVTGAEARSQFGRSYVRVGSAYAAPCMGAIDINMVGVPATGTTVTFNKYRGDVLTPAQLWFAEVGDCLNPKPGINESGATWGSDGTSGTLTFTNVGPVTYETQTTGFVGGMLTMVPVYGETVEFTLEDVSVAALTTEENQGILNHARGSFVLNGTFRTNCFEVH